MWRTVTLTAYDALDTVQVVTQVRGQSGVPEEPMTLLLQWSTSIPSTGEDDDREWVRDALLAALEAI